MNQDTMCRLAECERPIKNKTQKLCNPHYIQWYRGKPFTEPKKRRLKHESPICAFTECDEAAAARTLCSTHYAQWSNTGETWAINSRQRPRGSTAVRDHSGRKQCARCLEWREVESYGPHPNSMDGLRAECAHCRSKAYQRDRVRILSRAKEIRFNLKPGQAEDMLEAQGNRCGVCRTDAPGTKGWVIDHDHACCPEPGRSCGKCVRAILCGRCNLVLGQADDDVEVLARMIDYLTEHTQRLQDTTGTRAYAA